MEYQSIGEQRVRTKFNPSDDSVVDQIKQKTAELINIVEDLKTNMSNRKLNGFFAYVLLAVVLSACGHSIHEGEIIEKYYEPPRHYTYTTMMMVGKVMIPQTHTGYDDEDWIIVVKGVNGKDTITEDFYIDETNWKCMNVGNIFNDSIPCTTDDDGTK